MLAVLLVIFYERVVWDLSAAVIRSAWEAAVTFCVLG
mgnify:CR=1 FL=1